MGIGRGFPLPNRLGGLGERREPTHFGIFEGHRTLLIERTVLLYVPTKPFFALKNPLNRRLGAWPPRPPLTTPLATRHPEVVGTITVAYENVNRPNVSTYTQR